MRAEAAEADSGTGGAVIDTRAFAAGSAIRFVLLLAFVTVESLTMMVTTVLWWRQRDTTESWFEWCRLAVGYDPMQPYFPPSLVEFAEFVDSCDAEHNVGTAGKWAETGPLILGGATALVFVLAAGGYLLGPAWRRRGGRLLPVDLDSTDDLARRLRGFAEVAELPRTPAFVIDPRADAVGAVVFGRLGRYTVCLNAGLVARGTVDPTVLRDVVLHELAHIRNRDVDITYATVAVWRAFLICAVLPNLAGHALALIEKPELWDAYWELAVRGVLGCAVLAALTYLVRADILRTREVYADIDAARMAGETAFGWRPGTPPTSRTAALRQRLLSLWRTHPMWSDRRRALRDPGPLFGAAAVPMFLTGLTGQLANVGSQPYLLNPQWTFSIAEVGISTWIASVLIAGVTGYILWRWVTYAVSTGRRVPSGLGAGLWLGAGMALGELLTFRTAAAHLLPPDPEVLLVFLISAPLFTWWVTRCAEIWVRGHRGRHIRWVQIAGLAAALMVFVAWYGYWMSGMFAFLQGPLWLSVPGTTNWFWDLVVRGLAHNPPVLVAATVLWLFPLLAAVRRANTAVPAWVAGSHSTPVDSGISVYREVSLRPAAVGALAGGVLSWLTVGAIMAHLHARQPPRGAMTDEYMLSYPRLLSIGLMAALALTASAVSFGARRYRMMTALAAAGGGGVLAIAGLFVLMATDGCVRPLRVMAYSCAWRPNAAWPLTAMQVPYALGIGVFLALAAALLGAAARAALRRTGAVHPGPMVERPLVRRRLAVVLVGAAAIGLVAHNAIEYYSRPAVEVEVAGGSGHAPEETPPAIARRVDGWLRVGGTAKGRAVYDELERVRAVVNAALRAAEAQPSTPVTSEAFVPACSAVVARADDAAAFIPVPDHPTQVLWATYLAVARKAGDTCRRSFEEGDDDLFNRSMNYFVATDQAYQAFLRRFDEINGVGGG